MSFFFLYHPSSVAWLPAPHQLDASMRKKKLKLEKEEKKRRQIQEEDEALILMILGDEEDG